MRRNDKGGILGNVNSLEEMDGGARAHKKTQEAIARKVR